MWGPWGSLVGREFALSGRRVGAQGHYSLRSRYGGASAAAFYRTSLPLPKHETGYNSPYLTQSCAEMIHFAETSFQILICHETLTKNS